MSAPRFGLATPKTDRAAGAPAAERPTISIFDLPMANIGGALKGRRSGIDDSCAVASRWAGNAALPGRTLGK
eukprot:10691527-Alexandrium_andersonii.AAC.1